MTAALAPTLTVDEARALTDAIRADLASAVGKLWTAIDRGVPAALGYPSSWAWADAELGDLLRQFRLPRQARLALVESMEDMSVREIAERLGVSPGTIHNDRVKLGRVIPIGPRRKARPAPAERPAWGKRWEVAARHIAEAEDGLTLVELARVMGVTEGSASGLLTYLLGKRLAVRTEVRRDGQRVHVLADA